MFAACREKWEAEQRELGHALHGHYRWTNYKLVSSFNWVNCTGVNLNQVAFLLSFCFVTFVSTPAIVTDASQREVWGSAREEIQRLLKKKLKVFKFYFQINFLSFCKTQLLSERFEAEQEREYGDWKERLREREEKQQSSSRQQQGDSRQQAEGREVKNNSHKLEISWGCARPWGSLLVAVDSSRALTLSRDFDSRLLFHIP